MSPSGAEAFLERFVNASDEVIATMTSRLHDLSGLDVTALDESTSSLRVLWEAIEPLIVDMDELGLERYAADPPPMWWQEGAVGMGAMKRNSLWLRDGVIHYAMRCRLAESDGLWLEWDRSQEYEAANQPCIVGYTGGFGRSHPIIRGLAAYGGAVMAARGGASPVWGSEPVAVFVGHLGRDAEHVPEPGGERIEPVWIEEKVPYELSDVEVSRPSSRELGSVLDEAGHDWDGSWLVELPAAIGIDINMSPDPGYAGILEEALVATDGVLRATWVSHVVYLVDAPRLSKKKLRKAILDVLNHFRSLGG